MNAGHVHAIRIKSVYAQSFKSSNLKKRFYLIGLVWSTLLLDITEPRETL